MNFWLFVSFYVPMWFISTLVFTRFYYQEVTTPCASDCGTRRNSLGNRYEFHSDACTRATRHKMEPLDPVSAMWFALAWPIAYVFLLACAVYNSKPKRKSVDTAALDRELENIGKDLDRYGS